VKNEVEIKEGIIIKEIKLDNDDTFNVALNTDILNAVELTDLFLV
jgi:hypothetical protein